MESIEIAATPEAMSQVVEKVSRTAAELWGPDSEQAAKAALACQEALANAVVHGCREDPQLRVQCWVAHDAEHGLLIAVSDPGEGFDETSAPDPLSEEHKRDDHGRGLLLMRQLMDDVHFVGRGNEVHMRMK